MVLLIATNDYTKFAIQKGGPSQANRTSTLFISPNFNPSSGQYYLTQKVFRKEYNHNGLVNFYVGELLCEAIMPKIEKLENKEAMMVLSALNPSE